MPKKFVLAPDSFKESMSAKEVCHHMSLGIKKVMQDAEIVQVPMADGGEGTVDATGGQKIPVQVSGPFPEEKIYTYFGLLGDGQTAVIEMAKANGIGLLSKEKRNPLKTSTFGTGQLILAALDYGVKKIIIGIGGSVTNDGGAGMAAALGARFLDASHEVIPFGGGYLSELAHIDVSNLYSRLEDALLQI
ncbi:glycerate kinase domain protein [Streptococcus ictaluri 707-05]|uniref:Glycerate kinase domain protein n=1 Tax=Streptococcus ictaluri 707-05 TaxID=764299 RepID=G5K548_9STRE|nr:glycerate kinase domain protein [Streptococcus ictaluri 707-05]